MNAIWQVLYLLIGVAITAIWWHGIHTSPLHVDRRTYDFEEMLVGLCSLTVGGVMYVLFLYFTNSFYGGIAPAVVFLVGCGVIMVRRRKKHEAELKAVASSTSVD